jgi:hypothetical protein
MKLTDTGFEGVTTTLEFNADDMDIDELLIHFTHFLRGCGYVIDSDQYITMLQHGEFE